MKKIGVITDAHANLPALTAALAVLGGETNLEAPVDMSKLPELPVGWMWSRLQDIGELGRGKSKHRPRNDERLMGGPYPFIQTAEVRLSNGKITSFQHTYSEFGLAQSRLWPAGTLCITIAANIAETGILSFEACFSDSVVGFIIYPSAGDAKFIEAFIRTEKDNLERLAPATAQKNINLDTLSKIWVPLPPSLSRSVSSRRSSAAFHSLSRWRRRSRRT